MGVRADSAAVTYLTDSEIVAINRVRRICESVQKRCRDCDAWQDGLIFRQAEIAEEGLFDLLNRISSYGHQSSAGRAIDAYRDETLAS